MQLYGAHDDSALQYAFTTTIGDDDDDEMCRLIDSIPLLSMSSTIAYCDDDKQTRFYFKCNNKEISKNLQTMFECNLGMVKTHFKSILYYCEDMILDGYGNYLLTSIIDKCDDLQRYTIIKRLGCKVLEASMTITGSRCVQHMIESSKDDERSLILLWRLLKPEAESLCSHLYGNHCIQKLLGTTRIFCFLDLVYKIIENLKPLCLNRYGSYVVQRCFDLVSASHPLLRLEMVKKLGLDFFELSTTRVGNYGAQYLILNMASTDLDLLMDGLKGNIVSLACDAYGSNVLESLFIRKDNSKVLGFIVSEMVGNPTKLYKIISDRYGQYCMEKAIKELNVSTEGRQILAAITGLTPLFIGTLREKKVVKTLHDMWFH